MNEVKKNTRKLRAILSADVKGYSLLMADDESYTVEKLKKYRNAVSDLVRTHSGRVVDAVGDNMLAEFASALDAVQCAVEIQQQIKLENTSVSQTKRLEFRIGINIGDIIQDQDHIYGDGINIASRIEQLAEPGGVCISRNTYDHVRNKLTFGYEYLGAHNVKNIKEPVRIYKVLMDSRDAGKIIGEEPKAAADKRLWPAVMAAAIVLTIIGYQFYHSLVMPEYEIASVDNMAYPLPDEPSIAVMPFTNMSGDPEQDYLSDGFTEHIITSLSKTPHVLVIARNSTFAYKGKSHKIQQIAEELSVRYVLEGSLQRANDRLRITAQLIDATTGHHIWAENYDRKMEDIFALQDDISMNIMAELQVKLTDADMGRSSMTQTSNIKAYEKILQGIEYLHRRTEGDIQQARRLAQEALALDPNYGIGYLLLAWTHLDDIWFYRTESREKSLKIAEELNRKAISLSGQDDGTHRLQSCIYMLRKQYDKAIAEAKLAIDYAPNSVKSYFIYGMVLRNAERYNEAIPVLQKAIRLNPFTPVNHMNNLAWSYTGIEQYDQAISLWKRTIVRNPDYLFAYMGLVVAYYWSGDEIKAREAVVEVLRIKPALSMEVLEKRVSDIKDKVFRNRMLEAFRKSGIPEHHDQKESD